MQWLRRASHKELSRHTLASASLSHKNMPCATTHDKVGATEQGWMGRAIAALVLELVAAEVQPVTEANGGRPPQAP